MTPRPPSFAYAGIGSRKTPADVLERMQRVARRLASLGYTLRSGAAEGADSAFELGAAGKEIYLPWKGFNQHPSELFDLANRSAAAQIAAKHHPAWSRLSQGAIKLHTRNVYQVLGQGLDLPADFVLCWTPDGAECAAQRSAKTGGTGMAIVIAEEFGVPIFNLANEDALERLGQHLATLRVGSDLP
jgi:hypothetical protein